MLSRGTGRLHPHLYHVNSIKKGPRWCFIQDLPVLGCPLQALGVGAVKVEGQQSLPARPLCRAAGCRTVSQARGPDVSLHATAQPHKACSHA